jgi:RNA polymerase sigma-70 factor (ECF subfamily)
MTINEYNKCVDEYSDGIYRFLLKNIRDTEIARDLVQESFMKLWVKRKDVESGKSKSYLFSTAYHTMIDYIRKNDRMTSLEGNEHHVSPTFENYSDLKEVLDEALKLLPDIQRSVLLLRDYEGYSYKEIGEITSLTESQVKVYIYRARLFLKKYIVAPDYVI